MNNNIQHKNYILVLEILKLNTVGLSTLSILHGAGGGGGGGINAFKSIKKLIYRGKIVVNHYFICAFLDNVLATFTKNNVNDCSKHNMKDSS